MGSASGWPSRGRSSGRRRSWCWTSRPPASTASRPTSSSARSAASCAGTTTIVISHDPALVRCADRVLLVEDGAIAEDGHAARVDDSGRALRGPDAALVRAGRRRPRRRRSARRFGHPTVHDILDACGSIAPPGTRSPAPGPGHAAAAAATGDVRRGLSDGLPTGVPVADRRRRWPPRGQRDLRHRAAAVDQRSPAVASALDPEQARARARSGRPVRTGAGPRRAGRIGALSTGRRLHASLPRPPRPAAPGTGPARRRAGLRIGDVVVRPFPAGSRPAHAGPRRSTRVLMRTVLGRVVPGTGGERPSGAAPSTSSTTHGSDAASSVTGSPRAPVERVSSADPCSSARCTTILPRRPPRPRRCEVLQGGLRSGIRVPSRSPSSPGCTWASPRRSRTAAAARLLATARRRWPGVGRRRRGGPWPPPPPCRRAPGDGCGARPRRGTRSNRAAPRLLEPVWPDVAAHLRRGVARALAVDHSGSAARGQGPLAPVLARGELARAGRGPARVGSGDASLVRRRHDGGHRR